MAKEKLTYSGAVEELEGIIEEIESGRADVDVLTEKVKRAAFLIGFCKDRLKGTEVEVKKVLEGLEEDGPEETVETVETAETEDESEPESDALF